MSDPFRCVVPLAVGVACFVVERSLVLPVRQPLHRRHTKLTVFDVPTSTRQCVWYPIVTHRCARVQQQHSFSRQEMTKHDDGSTDKLQGLVPWLHVDAAVRVRDTYRWCCSTKALMKSCFRRTRPETPRYGLSLFCSCCSERRCCLWRCVSPPCVISTCAMPRATYHFEKVFLLSIDTTSVSRTPPVLPSLHCHTGRHVPERTVRWVGGGVPGEPMDSRRHRGCRQLHVQSAQVVSFGWGPGAVLEDVGKYLRSSAHPTLVACLT